MQIAENQAPERHLRYVSGRNRTPTRYFPRAPGHDLLVETRECLRPSDYPNRDEDTYPLAEPVRGQRFTNVQVAPARICVERHVKQEVKQ